jgi:hypothetical protein
LAGAGGGGRVALLTPGQLIEGDVLINGGESNTTSGDNYRQNELVAYWTLDEDNSTTECVNQTGIQSLDGNILGAPQRVAGVKGGAFSFDGIDDRIIVDFNESLLLDKYSVSLWIYPQRNSNVDFTGLFGRSGRNYVIFLGNSSNPNNPFIHHRFGEGFNTDEGVNDFNLSGWNNWYHIVCSNGGIGGVARTYVNGKFMSSGLKFERNIVRDLIKDSESILNIGADYGSSQIDSWGHYLGRIDEVKLFNVDFGVEDVYHIFKGDKNLSTYEPIGSGLTNGIDGSFLKVLSPAPLQFDTINLTYGTKVSEIDFNVTHTDGLEFVMNDLPLGLSNQIPFLPSDIPDSIAWYQADSNNSSS